MFNIGSGDGISIIELGRLMKSTWNSKVPLDIREKRKVETENFISDTKKLRLKTKRLENGLKLMRDLL